MPNRDTRAAIQTVTAAVKYAYHRKTFAHLTTDDVIAAEKVQRWLDETVEVQAPRPDWSQAPEWAVWWCIDANGDICWTDAEPQLRMDWDVHWYAERMYRAFDDNGDHLYVDIPLGIDWRLLKQKRPETEAA